MADEPSTSAETVAEESVTTVPEVQEKGVKIIVRIRSDRGHAVWGENEQRIDPGESGVVSKEVAAKLLKLSFVSKWSKDLEADYAEQQTIEDERLMKEAKERAEKEKNA